MTLLKSTHFDSVPNPVSSPNKKTNIVTLLPEDTEQITTFFVLQSSATNGVRSLSHKMAGGTGRCCYLCVPAPRRWEASFMK